MDGRKEEAAPPPEDRILREKEVIRMTGLSRSRILTGIAEGWFPRSVRLNPNGRAIGWRLSRIQEWIRSRPDG